MLDEHFEDQMNEIIKLCPVKRQTMLFSATMTDKVRSTSATALYCIGKGSTKLSGSW